jgi:hypothetical protein
MHGASYGASVRALGHPFLQHEVARNGHVMKCSCSMNGAPAACLAPQSFVKNFRYSSGSDGAITGEHAHDVASQALHKEAQDDMESTRPSRGTTEGAEPANCTKAELKWQLLPRHGCTVKERVCVDQVCLPAKKCLASLSLSPGYTCKLHLHAQHLDCKAVACKDELIEHFISCAGALHCIWG